MSKYKKVAVVASAQLGLARAPAGVAFLAGVCEHLAIDYKIWDLNIELLNRCGQDVWDRCNEYTYNDLDLLPADLMSPVSKLLDDVVSEIKTAGCDCVAVTVFSYVQMQWTEWFLRRCQQQLPGVTTIIGGPGVGSVYQLRHTEKTFGAWAAEQGIVNYYALGEGDEVFPRFLQGETDMLGLNQAGQSDTWQPQIDDMDAQIRPSYRQVNFGSYKSPRNQPVITLNGSRGCVRKCTFCDVGAQWKKFRYRSGASLAQEIKKHYEDTGVTEYWFSDSLINGSIKQFYELLETLKQYNLTNLNFSGQFIIRPQQSHREHMFQLMAETGFRHVAVGVESGSERVRDHMGKKFSNEDIDYHLVMCERYGITNYMLTIVGYPTETEEDFQATLDMYRRYQRYTINNTILGINLKYTMTILPNTPISTMQQELEVEWIHGEGHQMEWRAASNPKLTVKRRYERWIELLKLVHELRYNLSEEVLIDIATNQRKALSVRDSAIIQDTMSIIPIQAPSALLS